MSRKCNPRWASFEVSGRHHRTREPARMGGNTDTGPEIPHRAVLAAADNRRVDAERAAVHPKGSCDLTRLNRVSTHLFGIPQRFSRRIPLFSSCAERTRQVLRTDQLRSDQGVFPVYQVSMINRKIDAPDAGAVPFSLDTISTGGVVRPGYIPFFSGAVQRIGLFRMNHNPLHT